MRFPDGGAIGRRGSICVVALALAGCGGPTLYSPDNSASTKLANLLAFNSTSTPTVATGAGGLQASASCPEVVVLEGTAAQRVFAGAESSENLRYQSSIGDVARECYVQGNQLTIKVGIEGRVLLGPAGSPGNFTVPIRIAVLSEKTQEPVTSKIYRIPATIAPGQSATNFSFLVEPLVVPNVSDHSDDDYNIKLGIDAGGAGGAEKVSRRRKRT